MPEFPLGSVDTEAGDVPKTTPEPEHIRNVLEAALSVPTLPAVQAIIDELYVTVIRHGENLAWEALTKTDQDSVLSIATCLKARHRVVAAWAAANEESEQ